LEKTVQNIPFLRLAIALVIGIIAGTYFAVDIKLCFALLVLILIILILFNRNYRYSDSIPFGLGIQFFIIFLGILVTQQFNKKPVLYEKGNFMAVILETPQEKPNSWKSVIQIDAVYYSDSVKPTKELAIAYFAKAEAVKELKSGDIILFSNVPQQITNNNNPFEFDYKKYLEQKRIYRQVYLSADNWIKANQSDLSLSCRAEQIRESLLKIYRSQPIDETEFEILSALTLGYKRELDPETKRIFSASGASHVLAVSGLHVGIVFWVISLLFGFLQKRKSGRILFMILSISILWFYAFITGLSPSVMRASAMFSIFVIGENLHRKSNIYNSLAASAFILLLINPNNLYDTGFQLSYAAVFGIVFLQPKLEKLVLVKNKFIRFFWSLITVSIAAQIATFPITTYYFGQFPTYFWITNSFVIPAVMVLIPLGILLLFVSKIYVFSNLLAIFLNYLIKITYFLLSSIDQLPFSVFEISINQIQLILIIAILSSIFIYLKSKKANLIKATLLFALLLSLSTLITETNLLNHKELIVYSTPMNPAIHLIHGKKNYIISEEKIKDEELYYFPGTSTKRKLGLNPPVFLISTDSITDENIMMKNGLVFFEGKSLSFQKKMTDLNEANLPDFIINPSDTDINTSDFKPGTTIVSNKRYLVKNENNSGLIHYTNIKGAFRIKW
jgi:competence protein ComEC